MGKDSQKVGEFKIERTRVTPRYFIKDENNICLIIKINGIFLHITKNQKNRDQIK